MKLEHEGFPMAAPATEIDPSLRAAVPTFNETGIDLRRGLSLDPRLQPASAAEQPHHSAKVARMADPTRPLAVDSRKIDLDPLAHAATPFRHQVGLLMAAAVAKPGDER